MPSRFDDKNGIFNAETSIRRFCKNPTMMGDYERNVLKKYVAYLNRKSSLMTAPIR
jgi:hypothetical protein